MTGRRTNLSFERTDRDTLTSWLQQREMKDRKLGDARSGRLSAVFVRSTIERMEEFACREFPEMDRELIAETVRAYVDPKARLQQVM